MIGETLGSYRIVSEIGKGGMGVVFLGEHALLGRQVAVKVLRADVTQEQVERFFNEARAAATLRHSGLVDVFDFGHHTDGSAFIVMEYLAGESLAERLAHEPRLPFAVAGVIARGVANALAVAHREGIIHRDLKPANVFLATDAEAATGFRTKVLDFGIAKLVREQQARSVMTHSGTVIGTPRYMSPEQCKNAKSVDGRADIYSLGCILYEMLLGVPPFDYDSWAELVGAHLYEDPPRPRELDPACAEDIEALVVKMLEKQPDARHPSMLDLSQAIDDVLRAHGEAVPRPTPPPTARPVTTPPLGTRAIAADAAASDPTLAAQSASLPRVGTDPTLQQSGEPSGERSGEQTEPVRRRSNRTLALVAGAIVVAAGATVAIAMVLGKRTHEPDDKAFVVVDRRGSGQGGPTGAGSGVLQPMQHPVEGVDAGVAAAVVDAAATSADHHPRPPPTETDTQQLTRTFGRQTAAVTACFREHPDDVPDGISIRISIDVAGHVVAAQVLPATVAASALGACLSGVASQTAFGPQPKAVTFRVPIHTATSGGS